MATKSLSFFSIYRALLRRLNRHRRNPNPHLSPYNTYLESYPCQEELCDKTVVVDLEGGLLRSSTTFPYFMLVALEAGALLRGLFLLLLWPFICCLNDEVKLKVMVMVSFCGLKEKEFRTGRAVLPKFFLENVGLEGFDILRKGGNKVICVSCMPIVMVEFFLKEYMELEKVVGRELKVLGGYYTGFMEKASENLKDLVGDQVSGVVGFGSCSTSRSHGLFSLCNEVYRVNEGEKAKWHPLPREKFLKPLIFHDGRIAFRPTPADTLAMFTWLPFGFVLGLIRIALCTSLSYTLIYPVCAFLGMKSRLIISPENNSTTTNSSKLELKTKNLYVANHRTLLDPIYIGAAINKPVTAVVYSLSRISEFLSPIPTVRLTRNKEEDRRRMKELIQHTDVVVHPEGTTCREPYLLRFSPLFAELTDEIVPVALAARVGMFYGTSAGGMKGLDPLFFMLNPCPEYDVEILEKKSTKQLLEKSNSYEVANHVQRELAHTLGFQCTSMTRRDKYMMLAGNEGLVSKKT